MSTRKPLLAVVLMLVIAFSFLTLMQLEKNNSLTFNATSPLSSRLQINNQFNFLTNSVFPSQTTIIVKEPALATTTNSTRTDVYNFIVANPGMQFRGICTGLGIAIGTAEFHLGILKKAGLISFVRDGKYKRFFTTKKFSVKEMKLISLLRHETIREILRIISAEKEVSHCKLASNLSITSQGLTWQMNRLREEGVIRERCDGVKVTYSLNEINLQALPELLSLIEQ